MSDSARSSRVKDTCRAQCGPICPPVERPNTDPTAQDTRVSRRTGRAWRCWSTRASPQPMRSRPQERPTHDRISPNSASLLRSFRRCRTKATPRRPRSRRRPSRVRSPAATCWASPRPAPARPPPSPCRSCTAWPPTARPRCAKAAACWCSPPPANSPARSAKASAPTAGISASRWRSVFGGVGHRPQIQALARGVDVLVADARPPARPHRGTRHRPVRHRGLGARRGRPDARPRLPAADPPDRRPADDRSVRTCSSPPPCRTRSASWRTSCCAIPCKSRSPRRPRRSTASSQRVLLVESHHKRALLVELFADPQMFARARLHAHQARRRQGRPPPRGGRHQRRRDPRQQEPGPARARAGGLQGRPRSAPWSPPTSPRAASTSTRSRTS